MIRLYLIFSFLFFSGSCKEDTFSGDTIIAQRESNLALGNPSHAGNDLADSLNYLIEKTDYTLSYNKSRATANWVSWHLNTAWLGTAPRQDNFKPDNTLPEGWYRVSTSNYTNTGFDRGHLCPSADRTYSVAENSETFLLSNIVPQAPKNNQQTWARLEDYCRDLAAQHYELYITAGIAGLGGEGSKGKAEHLNNGSISVPAKLWKIILVIPEGQKDILRINNATRVIAVIMPNSQSSTGNWADYRSTVDEIEQLTGYDFFSKLSNAIQHEIESRKDELPID